MYRMQPGSIDFLTWLLTDIVCVLELAIESIPARFHCMLQNKERTKRVAWAYGICYIVTNMNKAASIEKGCMVPCTNAQNYSNKSNIYKEQERQRSLKKRPNPLFIVSCLWLSVVWATSKMTANRKSRSQNESQFGEIYLSSGIFNNVTNFSGQEYLVSLHIEVP